MFYIRISIAAEIENITDRRDRHNQQTGFPHVVLHQNKMQRVLYLHTSLLLTYKRANFRHRFWYHWIIHYSLLQSNKQLSVKIRLRKVRVTIRGVSDERAWLGDGGDGDMQQADQQLTIPTQTGAYCTLMSRLEGDGTYWMVQKRLRREWEGKGLF